MRRFVLPTSVLLSAFSASACSDGLVSPEPGALVQTSALATAAPLLVIVAPRHSGAGADKGAGGITVDNIADAVALVRPAGTIRVVRGRYVTEDVLIDKPLTIVGIGTPEIVNEVGTTSLLIAGLGEGTVVIEGLAFRNEAPPSGAGFFEQSSSIALENGFDDLIVQENSFSGLPGNGLHIFQRTRTEALTPSVTLRDNEFRTGRRALRIDNRSRPTVSVSITGNLVSDFSDRGMHLFGVTGFVGDNDMSLCGSWCVRARGSGGLDVSDNRMHDCAANGTNPGLPISACISMGNSDGATISRNQLSDRTVGNGPHTAILVFSLNTSRSYLIEGNVIDGCGDEDCIVSDGMTESVIRGNQITTYLEDETVTGIVTTGRSGAGNDVIDENTVRGVGGVTPDDDGNLRFPMIFAISVGGGPSGSSAVANGNIISGANHAFNADVGAALSGTDNHASGVGAALGIWEGGQATLQRSDFLIEEFFGPVTVFGEGDVDLRCNFWGPDGPRTEGLPASVLLFPFSPVPIANDATVDCDPDAPAETVRLATADNGSGFPFFATLTAALSAVATGGTVLVADGEHQAVEVHVNRSVTVEAEGPGTPTIDFQNSSQGFTIGGDGLDVAIRGLRLMNAAFNGVDIRTSSASHFLIEGNEIHPSHRSLNPANSGNGVFANTRDATLEIRGNHFIGGDVGVELFQTSNATLENNTFDGHLIEAFRYVGSDGRAEGNTVSGCAITCFTVLLDYASSVEILGNRFEIDIVAPMDAQAFAADGGGARAVCTP